MRPLKPSGYGANFVSQDMSGWDEMLPTIDACLYNKIALPDHGEVWNAPWQLEKAQNEVVLSVDGIALPYRLRRSASLITPNCLELCYRLVNIGLETFPYLWAAHPQFNTDAQTCIVLPKEVIQMVNVVAGEKWGMAGEIYSWPEAKLQAGDTCSLDRVGPVTNHGCRKFYTLSTQQIGWAGLRHELSGCELLLEWSAAELPYFGLWVDEGKYNAVSVVAFEPSNGFYDSLERAINNNRVTMLAPQQNVQWKLRLSLGSTVVMN